MDIEDRIKVCQEPQELLALIAECHDIDTLFKVWKVYNEKKPLRNKINGKMVSEKSAFISDGVLCLPEDRHDKWWLEPSYPKVLFILKDQYQKNDRWDEDIRNWLVCEDRGEKNLNLKPYEGRACIFRQLGRWQYGVHCIFAKDKKDKFVLYEEVTDSVIKDHIKDYPMAIMEAKKQPGGSNLDERVLKAYIGRDKDFIKKEIEILDPDIIICCDKAGSIYNGLLCMFDVASNEPNHCIGKIRDHTLVINTDHPSARKKRNPYYQVIEPLRAYNLCNKVKNFTSHTKDIRPYLDWNVWGDNKGYGINIQYPLLPKTRIGIEAFYIGSNKFCIYLRLWWNVDNTILHNIFGESLCWENNSVSMNATYINQPGALLEEIKILLSDEIARKVGEWHDKLCHWLNTRQIN